METLMNEIIDRDKLNRLTKAIEITVYLLAIALTVLLGLAGADKTVNIAEFQDGLKNSPFIPLWAAWPTAIATMLACFAVSGLLLFGVWKQRFMGHGLWSATGLLLVFTLYVAAVMTIVPYRPCICIGLDEKLGLGWGAHLLLNGTLLAVAWAATLLNYMNKVLVAISEALSQPLKNGKFQKKGGI